MWYPLTMAAYWKRAFQRRSDVDLKIVGSYTGAWIPWNGGMELMAKYAIPPDICLGGKEALNKWHDYNIVKMQLGDWEPDLIVTVDAMCNWIARPDVRCPVVTIGTDAHCLNDYYTHARSVSDKFFNMHKFYMKPGDEYLPYAFDPTVHYWEPESEKTSDCVCIGMAYKHRTQLVDAVRATGASVIYENGPIFDEYREINNKANIGLNVASSQDLNARVFELMAMHLCPVINNVPDLKEFFTEGVDYVGFYTPEEAAYKVKKLLETPEAVESIAEQAYDNVWRYTMDGYPVHSYDQRVHDLLRFMGMI